MRTVCKDGDEHQDEGREWDITGITDIGIDVINVAWQMYTACRTSAERELQIERLGNHECEIIQGEQRSDCCYRGVAVCEGMSERFW